MPLLFTGVTALANAMPDMRALTFLDISNNSLGELVLPEEWTIGVSCIELGHQDEYTHADGRKQMKSPCKAEGIIAIANAIKDMEAISSVNLLKNAIPVEQAQELLKIMQSKEKLTTLCGLSKEETKLDFSNQEPGDLGAGDVVLIANDISDMRALTSLDISKSYLYAEGTKLLAEALKSNQIMTAFNISSNFVTEGGMSGVVALADAIPDMGAISQFTFSGDGHGNTPVTMETSMTVADFSGKYLGTSGAIMLSAFLPKCT
jgi:hypothetical protein